MTQDERIDAFIDKYDPQIARQYRNARAILRKYFPRGFELVYNTYNALAIAYSTSDTASGVVMSVTAYPKWVSVFFTNGAQLSDPKKLLNGAGSRIRHIVLKSPDDLESTAVKQLIAQAIKPSVEQFAAMPKRKTIIKSAMAKHRPRRPSR